MANLDGADGSLRIHQDARLYLASLTPGNSVSHRIAGGRASWLQVLQGKEALDGHVLSAGDGAAVSDEDTLKIKSQGKSEIMLFDLHTFPP